jgi:hypothetical protein
MLLALWSGFLDEAYWAQGPTPEPVTPNKTLGGGGYHSWNLHYENQLEMKLLREEREKLKREEELKEEYQELKAKETKLVKSRVQARKLELIDVRQQLSDLEELRALNLSLLEEIENRRRIARNRIATLLLMASMPFCNITIN